MLAFVTMGPMGNFIPTTEDGRPSAAPARTGAAIDDRTWRHLRVHPPMWRCRDEDNHYMRLVVPSTGRRCAASFTHHSILVRLHVIGTPTTRSGPEQWRTSGSKGHRPQNVVSGARATA